MAVPDQEQAIAKLVEALEVEIDGRSLIDAFRVIDTVIMPKM